MSKFSLDKFFGVNNLLQSAELAEKLNENVFTLKDTGLTIMIMVNWKNHGLLFEQTDEGRKKFTFTEYIWIKVLDELRQIGVPLKVMKNVKDNLFQVLPYKSIFEAFNEVLNAKPKLLEEIRGSKQEKINFKEFLDSGSISRLDDSIGFSYFFLLLSETITTRMPLSLLIFKDGTLLPFSEEKALVYSKEDIDRITFHTHVKISLSEMIKEFLLDEKSIFLLPKLQILSPSDTKILQIISSGEYESITINFKERKAKSLRMVKSQDVKKRLVDILREGSYQDVEISTHDGMVTKLKNTIKVNLE